MLKELSKSWYKLQDRERKVLVWGLVLVLLMGVYTFAWQPWRKSVNHMESILPILRGELVWMREQEQNLAGGSIVPQQTLKDRDASLMSIIEKTARTNGVRDAIKQLTPQQDRDEVSVVLEGVSFNSWVQWIDVLQVHYGVAVIQLSAERDGVKADLAEIRMVVSR